MAYLKRERPARIGFHLPSWISPFVSLSKIAADYRRSKPGDVVIKSLYKDFYNGHRAEPWRDYTIERQEDAILALRDERPRGLIPPGDLFLTAAVDTQDYGFWYEIRAWQPGTFESWCIREGYLPCNSRQDFSLLEQVLFEDAYANADGDIQPIQAVVIDTGGHRTAECYAWCRKPGPCRKIPIKGEQRMVTNRAWGRITNIPGTNKIIPGGIQLLRINTTYYKNALASRLEIAPADPGAWHYHSETGYDWAHQMCAEYLDEEKQIWLCPVGRDNHAWDCSVYSLAVVDELMGAWLNRPKPPAPGPGRTPHPDRSFIPQPQGRPWLNR